MTLDALAYEIAAQAKVEAELIILAAKEQANKIEEQAKMENSSFSTDMNVRAEKESAQLSVELVASAKQANQKHLLIARREELDATWNSIQEMVSSPNLEGRSDILKSLMDEASKSGKDMVLRPVSIDRKALDDGNFTLGEDVEGLGGFVLESKDRSMVLDYRFDNRLEEAWKNNLGIVNKTLFDN
ncbi:MAG: V/A-type H+-transporting ATPase subunit E [Candidatus Thalassarchaeaceae archaeon]|jgi:V/A-type H+-transporting ATPase subunit E